MKTIVRNTMLGLACAVALAACNGSKTEAIKTGITTADMNASELLLLKTQNWITKDLKDANGLVYNGKDEFVSQLAGVTQYRNNGTFRTVSMDASVVFEGNWSISDDGRVLTLVGLGKDGRPGFNIDAPVIKLNNTEFSYRVYTNPNNRNRYFDVNMAPASIDDTRILTRQASVNPNSLTNTY